ncbi:MAG: metal-dependent hydrolase [Phototrophicales bacterium]|nr:metal-dependent hydrolase [Phototrophicales bacterium]
MSLSFTWLGHSTFRFDIDGHIVLIDPFLTGNPLAPIRPDEIHPELILVSHGHGDHIGDAVEIAKRSGAPVVTNVEIAKWLRNEGVATTVGMNIGGTYSGEFCSVKLTIANHSSSLPDGSYGGNPLGFVIKTANHTVYYAGDTAPFAEMAWIGDMGIDVAFLPIGDVYTMGVEDSLKAIELIRPRFVVPMHYATFPGIMQDGGAWANMVNSTTGATPIVLDPGGKYTVN